MTVTREEWDALTHDLRNSVIGLAVERRKLTKLTKRLVMKEGSPADNLQAQAKSLKAMGTHINRLAKWAELKYNKQTHKMEDRHEKT